MKSIDKKTIILISVLLTIATLVIVISQTAMDKTGGNKFGTVEVKTTTIITEASTTEITAPTTTTEPETPKIPETALQQDITETVPATEEREEPTNNSPVYTVYNTYSFENATLVISNDNRYVLSNDSASFSGNIRNVSNGDNVPIKNRKLKKLGLNPKTIDKNNLFYVQLEYDKHEFVKDGQTYVSYYNSNINAHAKKTSFNILIYDDENGTPIVYDLNGDITKTDFNNFYF